MMYWNTIVITACGALLLYLLWKEIGRSNKAWLWARIAATVVAITGLVGLAIPILYSTKVAAINTNEAILLTKGYSQDSLTFFLQKNKIAPVYTLVKNLARPGATYLPDVAFLHSDSNHFNRMHVFGNGLNEDELHSITNIPLSFHPSSIKTGISSVSWNQQATLGNKLRIQGRFINNEASPAKIILNGFGVHLDSCEIQANSSTLFELQTEPKHLDRALYSILALSGKDTVETEPVPIEVVVPKPVKVLVLAAYPDFENKFLKNWLAQSSYPVVARTRISKDKFTKDYENVPGITMNGITTTFLNQFDAIVADAAELSVLSAAESLAIQSAISQQGIGLIIKVDSSTASNSFLGKNFPLLREKGISPHPVKLHFTSDSSSTSFTLKIAQPAYIRELAGTKPLVQTEKGQTVISSRLQGAGRVVATIINNTYSWQLAGNTESYGAFWATLLQQVVKKQEQSEVFAFQPGLPVENEKVTVQLQTSFPEPPQVSIGADAISMEQNYQLPFMWQGYYWPYHQGWVHAGTSHQTVAWMYIFGKGDWQNVRAEVKKKSTQSRANNDTSPILQNQQRDKTIQIEIPKAYFFMLFLLSASFLWYERKYHIV